MNFINLLSVLESKNNLSDELFKKYLEYLNVILEDNEIEDLLKLIEKLVAECQSGRYPKIKTPFLSLCIIHQFGISVQTPSVVA
jgi:uncharacterized membrane protein YgaE (UPF0421/DUF939 family)